MENQIKDTEHLQADFINDLEKALNEIKEAYNRPDVLLNTIWANAFVLSFTANALYKEAAAILEDRDIDNHNANVILNKAK